MQTLQTTSLQVRDNQLWILDQQALPQQQNWLPAHSVPQLIEHIHALRVRGAPLIGLSASLLLAFLLMTIKYPLLLLIQGGGISLSPYNLLFGLISVLKSAGYLVFWMIIIRSIMSWVSRGSGPMDYVLMQLTEPLMAPIRRVIPAMGGIDFSAMVVVLILYMLNYLGMDLFGQLWFLL